MTDLSAFPSSADSRPGASKPACDSGQPLCPIETLELTGIETGSEATAFYEIRTIETPSLGDRSYLVHDGEVAFVVDPQRDIDRVLEVADSCGVYIAHIFETHVHHDYVSGGRALVDATGAAYHLNAADPVLFEREAIVDGQVITVSPVLRVRVLATPGHTFTHLAYSLEVGGESVAVFSGGSLLYGSTGRPDLIGGEYAEDLARYQVASARRLASELPDSALLLPTHGFGSFCSSSQSEVATSTIGQEKRSNAVLRLGANDYVRSLLASLDAFPSYYDHMASANLAGASKPDLSRPPTASAGELRRRIEAGEWVVDTRDRQKFAAGHLASSVNIGLDGAFATYLGWIIPWQAPVTLLAASAEELRSAQRELVRVGIDRPVAAAIGSPSDWGCAAAPSSLRRATFAELAAAGDGVVVLDVRRRKEWEDSHLAGALHIPLHELLRHLGDIPDGDLWIHCAAGYRASIAASLVERQGREVVLIDDAYANAVPATPLRSTVHNARQ